jgi:hypothetical protein|tara:strand:- start:2659 stop:2994 length:336 start_codon:yes stop_codon:yes gene_type:complete
MLHLEEIEKNNLSTEVFALYELNKEKGHTEAVSIISKDLRKCKKYVNKVLYKFKEDTKRYYPKCTACNKNIKRDSEETIFLSDNEGYCKSCYHEHYHEHYNDSCYDWQADC